MRKLTREGAHESQKKIDIELATLELLHWAQLRDEDMKLSEPIASFRIALLRNAQEPLNVGLHMMTTDPLTFTSWVLHALSHMDNM